MTFGRATAVGLVLLAAGVTACGGGGGGGTAPVPGPTPTPSPAPTGTPFPGGSTLSATITGLTPGFQSIVIRFNGSPAAPLNSPPGCGSGTCTPSVTALVGSNETVTVTTYQGINGTGSALQTASATASFFANQTTSATFTMRGIMATYTVSLTPSTVTAGTAATIAVRVNAFDANGAAISGTFVDATGAQPVQTATIADASGNTAFAGGTSATLPANAMYDGVGSSPATFTVTTPGYPSASAPLAFAPASPGTIAYAVSTATGLAAPFFIDELASNGAVLRNYTSFHMPFGLVRFDPAGTLWGAHPDGSAGLQGYKADGSSAGTMLLPGTLLTFDAAGRVYAADSAGTVHVYTVGAGNALTEVRQIVPPSFATSAAVDPFGNVYVGSPDAIREYPSTGSGQLAPLATNTTATELVTTDPAGDVFAVTSFGVGFNTVGEWTAGTFSAAAAPRSIALPGAQGTTDLAADATATLYAWARTSGSAGALFIAGPAATQATSSFSGATNGSVAAPLH